MEASTTIRQMLAGNIIHVPAYQRAYSWETAGIEKSEPPKHVNVFFSDLEDHNKSKSNYYFGHFLFEEKGDNKFGVIDGQQRLTTIIIFLSALFHELKLKNNPSGELREDEQTAFEDIIKRRSSYRFKTVDYDNQLFKDYVIDQTKKDDKGLETESAKRIVAAFKFFKSKLSDKDESYLLEMLKTIQTASCTTHIVKNESEAIQMFLFQNNRGKKPSTLEIIKAQFMFNIHLYGSEEKETLIEEIKCRFEKIYKSISFIENYMGEDEVLIHTLRVHFNSLWESNAMERISKLLSTPDSISFIKEFTQSLERSFDHLKKFFKGDEERESLEIHSFVTLRRFGITIPFILKAYKFNVEKNQINKLCAALESIGLRHKLIGTRADMTSRLNGVYQKFTDKNANVEPIVEWIDDMKTTTDWWWAYWNNNKLKEAIQGGINRSIAKYLLWKYENYLRTQRDKGYKWERFDSIKNPQLEHIAPVTPTDGKPVEAGYPEYNDEFKKQYIDCLGNYLLISEKHNKSIGNEPFTKKRGTYTYLVQQQEIQEMTESHPSKWTEKNIQNRKDKIIKFILENF